MIYNIIWFILIHVKWIKWHEPYSIMHSNLISMVEKDWGVGWLSIDPKSIFIKSFNTCPHIHVRLICIKEVPYFRILKPFVRPRNPKRCISFCSKIQMQKILLKNSWNREITGSIGIFGVTATKCLLKYGPSAHNDGANITGYRIEKRETSRLSWLVVYDLT